MKYAHKKKKQMQDTKPVFKFDQNLHHGFETTKLCRFADKFTSLLLANVVAMTLHFAVFDLFVVSYIMRSTH